MKCTYSVCLLVVCVSQIRPNLPHTFHTKFIPLNNKINLNLVFRQGRSSFFAHICW